MDLKRCRKVQVYVLPILISILIIIIKNENILFNNLNIYHYNNNIMSYITIPKTDIQVNKQLISNIYSSIDITKFRYDMISQHNELHKLLKQKYYVSVNFVGFNCLLVFTKIKEKFYCFTVDRQTLAYNINKLDFNKIKIEDRQINLDDKIYNGTVIDGTLIKSKNNKDLFIISDIYTFCGSDYTKTLLNIKMLEIKEYLTKYYDDTKPSNITLNVNKIFELSQIEKLVYNIMPKSKLRTRGLTFYPEISENKIIYLVENNNQPENKINNQQDNKFNQQDNRFKQQDNRFNQQDNKFNQQDNKFNQQDNKFNQQDNKFNQQDNKFNQQDNKFNQQDNRQISRLNDLGKLDLNHLNSLNQNDDTNTYKYVNTSGEPFYAILEMKSTQNIDVYNLYAVNKVDLNGKKILKRVDMGIAFIKGIDNSVKMRKIMSDNKTVLMKCLFNDKLSKFEPIEQDINVTFPTMLSKIEECLTLMEDN
jgi:hypothetical protein